MTLLVLLGIGLFWFVSETILESVTGEKLPDGLKGLFLKMPACFAGTMIGTLLF